MEVGAAEPDLTGPPERIRDFGPRAASVAITSVLAASRAEVWARVTTPAGIRDEMRPIAKMTTPAGIGRLDQVTVGEPVGRCWLLLGGLLPVDYDALMLARIDPGAGFVERSALASQRLWEHARTLKDTPGGGCAITDRLTWEPRAGLPGALFRPVISAFFRHRHRRLRRHFGAP